MYRNKCFVLTKTIVNDIRDIKMVFCTDTVLSIEMNKIQ